MKSLIAKGSSALRGGGYPQTVFFGVSRREDVDLYAKEIASTLLSNHDKTGVAFLGKG